jgi:hypothetical protein
MCRLVPSPHCADYRTNRTNATALEPQEKAHLGQKGVVLPPAVAGSDEVELLLQRRHARCQRPEQRPQHVARRQRAWARPV